MSRAKLLMLGCMAVLVSLAGGTNASTITPTGCTSTAPLSFGCNFWTSGDGDTLYMANAAISKQYEDSYTFTTTGPVGKLYAFRLDIGNLVLSDLTLTLTNGLPESPQIVELLSPGVLLTHLLLDTSGLNTLTIKVVADGLLHKGGYKAILTAVPLPAAAWLFISALGGLALLGRRRRMHAAA